MASIERVYSQDQSDLCCLNSDALHSLFSYLSFEEAVRLWPVCKKIYGAYLQYVANRTEYHTLFLRYFIHNKSPQMLEDALCHFSKSSQPVTLELDLLAAKNLKEFFQITEKKFPVSCITLFPEQSEDLGEYEKRLKSTLLKEDRESTSRTPFKRAIQKIKGFFIGEANEESIIQEKAELFSEALLVLGPTLKRIEVCPRGIAAFSQKVFVRTLLPTTLRQVKIAYQLEDQNDHFTVFSKSNLEEVEFSVNCGIKRTPFLFSMQRFAFPESLRSFSVQGYNGTVEDFTRLFDKLYFQCPKLEKLEVSSLVATSIFDATHLRLPPNLKMMTLKPWGLFDSTDIRRIFLKALLRNSSEVESLTLVKSALKDEEVCELLPSFKNLKDLRFDGTSSFISKKVVLLSKMELKSLTFEEISSEEFQFLRSLGKELLNKLQSLTIKRWDMPEKETLLDLLKQEYPHLSIHTYSFYPCFAGVS